MSKTLNPFNILIVEDDLANRLSIEKILNIENYNTWACEDGIKALDLLEKEPIDLVLSDLKMPHMDGMELLRNIQKKKLDVEFVMMTAHGTIETAVEAMQKGAQNFVTKPFGKQHLITQLEHALKHKRLKRENESLKAQLAKFSQQKVLIGNSKPVQELHTFISQVAPTTSTVLILGESGVGKEIVAQEIVNQSSRKNEAFVKLSCAALPDSLLEAELFGYEKGAFTGAHKTSKGRFEEAHQGTLFLDEIGEISSTTQVKLLRVLQEGEIFRLGSGIPVQCDVRIIAATNKNLETEVAEGRFREDLFFRLNVLNIEVTPLRERKDDIPLLISHFLKLNQTEGKTFKLTASATKHLNQYPWPGNVRELKNTIERACVLSTDGIIEDSHLALKNISQSASVWNSEYPFENMSLEQIERQVIEHTLSQNNEDKSLTAKKLNIALRTLYRKLESYK